MTSTGQARRRLTLMARALTKYDPFAELERDDPFAEAQGVFDKSASSFENITDYEDRLILATFIDFEKDVDTSFGRADRVTAEVVVLDGDDAPLELGEITIFQKVIISQLKNKKRPVLGVLVKKPYKDGHMWKMDSDQVTPEQRQIATAYILAHTAESQVPPPPPTQVRDQSGSEPERLFWEAHQRLGLPHLRGLVQQYWAIPNAVRVDFALPEHRLAIEILGKHHMERQTFLDDQRRMLDLSMSKWVVVTFSGVDINRNVDRCVRDANDWAGTWILERGA